MEMLGSELRRRNARKGARAGEHLLIDNRQTVLIAGRFGSTVKDLRSGVIGRQSSYQGFATIAQVFDQAEIAEFDVLADQHQVLRLDIQVLQRVVVVQIIQDLRRLAHVFDQFFAGNSRQTVIDAFFKQVC